MDGRIKLCNFHGEGKREKVIASVHKECYTDIYEVMKVWISQQQWQQSIISIW